MLSGKGFAEIERFYDEVLSFSLEVLYSRSMPMSK